MLKRFYLFIILFATLGLSVSLTSASADQKAKEKSQTHDAQVKAQSDAAAQALTLPAAGGTGSYLGVYLEEVTPERVKELGLSEERGAMVTKVVEGSPAEKAGLKENDVIVSFNERRIDSVRELQRILSETPADRSIKVEVMRGGSRQTLATTLSKRTSVFTYAYGTPGWDGQLAQTEEGRKQLEQRRKAMEDAWRSQSEAFKNLPDFGNFTSGAPGAYTLFGGTRLGVSAESLTDQLAEFFGVKDGHGVLVASVNEDSAAARAGLKAGDVIIAVDDQKIDGVNALVTALAKKEGAVTLKIIRNRAEENVTVTLEKRAEKPAVRHNAALIRLQTTV